MKLTIHIKNSDVFEKILWMLEHFKSDGVEIVKSDHMKIEDETVYSDEYIEQNWRDIVSNALSSFDEDYYKSEQYKFDRGEYLMEKYK